MSEEYIEYKSKNLDFNSTSRTLSLSVCCSKHKLDKSPKFLLEILIHLSDSNLYQILSPKRFVTNSSTDRRCLVHSQDDSFSAAASLVQTQRCLSL